MTSPTKYLVLIRILRLISLEVLQRKTKNKRNFPQIEWSEHVPCRPGLYVMSLPGEAGFRTEQMLQGFNIKCSPIKLTMEVQYQQLLQTLCPSIDCQNEKKNF